MIPDGMFKIDMAVRPDPVPREQWAGNSMLRICPSCSEKALKYRIGTDDFRCLSCCDVFGGTAKGY